MDQEEFSGYQGKGGVGGGHKGWSGAPTTWLTNINVQLKFHKIVDINNSIKKKWIALNNMFNRNDWRKANWFLKVQPKVLAEGLIHPPKNIKDEKMTLEIKNDN